MKKTWAFLGLLLISVAAYAALDWEIPNNVMKMGDGTTSSKSFEMKMGLGASNPIFSSADGTEMKINIPFRAEGDLTIGDGSAVDRTVLVDRGGSNPFIKWDETQSAWVFSNDGTLEKKIGSGSGGGDGGINVLVNANAEDGLVNWTNVGGGSFTEVTDSTRLEGEKSFEFNAISLDDRVVSDAVTLNDGLIGVACEARIYYTGGDENLILEVIDGNSDVIASQQLKTHEIATYESAFFTCPNAAAIAGDAQKGILQFQVRQSTGTNAAKIVFDKNHLGSLIGLVETTTPDTFGFIVDNTGAVINQSDDSVTSCTPNQGGNTGRFVCSVQGITENMSCTGIVLVNSAGGTYNVHTIGAGPSGITMQVTNAGAGYNPPQLRVNCHKTGADAKQSVQVYKSIPKAVDNVNTLRASFNVSGVATSINILGSISCTNPSTGRYTCSTGSKFTVNPVAYAVANRNESQEYRAHAFATGTNTIEVHTGVDSDGGTSFTYANTPFSLTVSASLADFKMPVVQPIVIPNAVFYGPYTLTVTGTNWTTIGNQGIFYTVNGSWRFKFNIEGNISGGSNSIDLTIAGITANASYIYQAVNGTGNVNTNGSNNTDAVFRTLTDKIEVRSGEVSSYFRISGDVALAGKPSMYVPQ